VLLRPCAVAASIVDFLGLYYISVIFACISGHK